MFYIFWFKHILPPPRSRGSKNTIFRICSVFSTFTVASAGIVDLQLEIKTQGPTKYKRTTTFHHRHAHFWPFFFEAFQKAFHGRLTYLCMENGQKVLFLYTFSRFFLTLGNLCDGVIDSKFDSRTEDPEKCKATDNTSWLLDRFWPFLALFDRPSGQIDFEKMKKNETNGEKITKKV